MEASRALRPAPDLLTDDYEVVARAARRIADVLGLRDWTVELAGDEPADGAQADVTVATGRRYARIRVCRGFLSLPLDERTHSLVHELVHVHVDPLGRRVRDDVGDELGGTAFRVFWRGFHRDAEHAVDALAAVIAPLIPPSVWE